MCYFPCYLQKSKQSSSPGCWIIKFDNGAGQLHVRWLKFSPHPFKLSSLTSCNVVGNYSFVRIFLSKRQRMYFFTSIPSVSSFFFRISRFLPTAWKIRGAEVLVHFPFVMLNNENANYWQICRGCQSVENL